MLLIIQLLIPPFTTPKHGISVHSEQVSEQVESASKIT